MTQTAGPANVFCFLSFLLVLLLAVRLQCVFNAHDSPLQCLEYSEEREELATCGMGNKVKIWSVKKPAQVGWRPGQWLQHWLAWALRRRNQTSA